MQDTGCSIVNINTMTVARMPSAWRVRLSSTMVVVS